MERLTGRKVLEYIGAALGVIGTLLVIGSIVVLIVGPTILSDMYEMTKPVIPFFLAGMGLLILGVLLAPGRMKPDTGPSVGGRPAEGIRCGKCAAHNESRAKFCNQCGTGALTAAGSMALQVEPAALFRAGSNSAARRQSASA